LSLPQTLNFGLPKLYQAFSMATGDLENMNWWDKVLKQDGKARWVQAHNLYLQFKQDFPAPVPLAFAEHKKWPLRGDAPKLRNWVFLMR
jgi:hypothetical protein